MQNIKIKQYRDQLTDIYNRQYFEKKIKEFDQKQLYPFSIILGNLNNLKKINENQGYERGNLFIKKTAEILSSFCDKNDIAARSGGDEFVILLPKSDIKKAEKISEEIIINYNFLSGKYQKMTLALGIASRSTKEQKLTDVYQLANNRMYRNKISVAGSFKFEIFSAFERMLGEKTGETVAHARRMELLSVKLAEKLKIPVYQIDELKIAARLHDIGKIIIADYILNKPGALTEAEFKKVKEHTNIGYRIIRSMPALENVANIILAHHERWDGRGYPRGLEKGEIPYLARIISIVDTYDVITHERPYKKSGSAAAALKEIGNCAGTQFDPLLAAEFIDLIKNRNQIELEFVK
ncbi:diguanylate cyclase (GGDEF)-like protein/putative nucleotidyltransferase with HDIG domain [Halanaerobium saccharolyticum]|uniref:Diguanylate cyclase (GGDEF)-like protein/putative nucleotidyltransferase with HDIG domain n=1 Tax=Halanaerobium saccharolyticum TaxID=43595 RepID=A0A4V3G4I8_9FIRM|nr:HD domain-containing phosphohydrolase [Halanaerobium saccharolyticum]RAK06326.1 diguanylate cyclase (GGDEF)-like protein/putative nucleotidyltransferase with HDIG domain [Halanaerobium saccharolyticum]TDW00638.1 diguanylate cyclase (GGDEF)-like protein/putative nucleotidyltransferase with HDIG domain [Halanaerobium saccharolyticum]TDX52251.1 diguanylate cyclase (GGDEF)-like protein/putative nucleotidyltransferase with HDIG domain [Halanaerobium saccharolyticum]